MRLAMSQTENPRSDVLDDVLRLGAGFVDDDRRWVLDALESLVPHLARWDSARLDVEISVKDRGGKEQQVTLLADLPGYPPLVAKAADRQLDRAIAEAKRELVREVEDAKGKREPKDNRHLRKKKS
jgi:ribosome-associated translation inhibitor RaiA